jgi:uncharacterized cupredoxin-like copper-binding protein
MEGLVAGTDATPAEKASGAIVLRPNCGEEERMIGTVRRALALIAIAGLLVCCSAPAASPGGTVAATLKEWTISLSPAALSAGKITFTIANNGDKDHEFVVRKTDLKADALPLNAEGIVDEESTALTVPAGDPTEVEDIAAGSTDKTLTLTLPAGHYVIFCNVHDEENQLLHYQKGMHSEFTVN